MPSSGRLVHETTVMGSFHGRVVAARLGADGIPVELRGMTDGPYPLPCRVDVFVRSEHFEVARELLLGDAVDAMFDESDAESDLSTASSPGRGRGCADPAASGSASDGHFGRAATRASRRELARLLALSAVVVLLVAGLIASIV